MRVLMLVFLVLSFVMITACAKEEGETVIKTVVVYLPTPGYEEGQVCFDLSKCDVMELQINHFKIKCKE